MPDLRTNYKDDVLDTSQNTNRKYNIKDANGNVLYSNVSLEDTTAYLQEGDPIGANEINAMTGGINDSLDRLDLNNTRNLVVPADINYTARGVTIQTNADGSITLSGQNTHTGAIIVWYDLFSEKDAQTFNPKIAKKWLPNGKYTLYGDAVGGRIVQNDVVIAKLQVHGIKSDNTTSELCNTENGQNKNFVVTDTYKGLMLRVWCAYNADFGSGMTIYPMITTQSTENVTGYEQGALSNRALTIKAQELKANYINDSLRANLVNPTAQTQTKNGLTFTNNGDGTYTVNGTASAWTFVNLNYVNSSTLSVPIGTYKLTGTPYNNAYARLEVVSPNGTFGNDIGNGRVFTIPQGTSASWVRISIDSGTTCNNLRFKPMITTDLDANYDDFVRYTGGSGRLNEDVSKLNEDVAQLNTALGGKKIVVCPEAQRGSDPNTLYFCY